MIIFKDILTEREMVSDAYPIFNDKPVKGMMTVVCKMKKGDGVGNYDIGANASQEEEAEQVQEAECAMKVDVVECFKLEETQMTKKAFKEYLKDELKSLLAKVKENMADCKVSEDKIKDKTDALQKDAQGMAKWVLENYKDIQLMIGDDFNQDCMPGFLIDKGTEGIHIHYFTHALEEEKC